MASIRERESVAPAACRGAPFPDREAAAVFRLVRHESVEVSLLRLLEADPSRDRRAQLRIGLREIRETADLFEKRVDELAIVRARTCAREDDARAFVREQARAQILHRRALAAGRARRERVRPTEQPRGHGRDPALVVTIVRDVLETAAREQVDGGADGACRRVERRVREVLLDLRDDFGPKQEDRVELASHGITLSLAIRLHAEEPRDEVADVRRQPDEQIGNRGRFHALAERGPIVLELAVKVALTLRELTDELGVQAREPGRIVQVLVPETGDAERQLFFSGHGVRLVAGRTRCRRLKRSPRSAPPLLLPTASLPTSRRRAAEVRSDRPPA